MTPGEHYAEAERLLEFADGPSVRCTAEGDQALEAAKVHATLASAPNATQYEAQAARRLARAKFISDARSERLLAEFNQGRCRHDWEPLDLPDPMSAGAVIQSGSVCRKCGREEP